MIYDLHIHTKYSDGQPSAKEVVYISKEKNIGVAITDHNHIKGAIEGYNLSVNLHTGFLCGIELGTKDGKEMLIYFKNPQDIENFYIKEVEPYKTNRMTRLSKGMETFLNSSLKREYNILFTTLPHPFGHRKQNINFNKKLSNKIIDFVDSIEVINGTLSKASNFKAYLLAKKIDKPMIASSDAHLKRDIGKVLTDIKIENNHLSTAIKNRNYKKNSLKTLFQIMKSHINYSVLNRPLAS